MKYLIFCLALILSGCFQQVNNSDIQKALHFCKSAENIEYVAAHFNGVEVIRCMDGSSIETSEVKVTQ